LKLVLVTLSVLVAIAGCRTATFTTRDLPVAYQAPLVPPSSDLKLERMGTWAVGSSQIEPGDLVSITILSGNADEKPTPFPARVAQDGTVTIPLVGAVPIGGLEPVLAEQRIATAGIERGVYRQPHVTLGVTERAVNRVTVIGAVAKPGVVELPRGSSDLASAIAAAGGLTAEAGTQVEILHRTNPLLASERATGARLDAAAKSEIGVKPASYTDVTNVPNGPTLEVRQPSDAELTRVDLSQAGDSGPEGRRLSDRDVVMVQPREKRFIHVTGLVAKPNQFELVRGKDIHVLDAIAMAGGTTSIVADKVLVIRQLPNMREPAAIKVSVAAAKRNGDENLRLAAGDLVSVESTPATMLVDTVGKFFRIGLGLNSSLAAF
jgi:polysaccharide export outer membrane protein